MSNYRVIVAGATGAVGQEILRCLDTRSFPLKELRVLASSRSVGKKILFRGQELTVELLSADAFAGADIVLSSTSGTLSKEFTPAAVRAGAVVIDNTSAFRMDPTVPLVVPEVNARDIASHKGIIANPNCSTILAAVPLWPLHKAYGLRQLVVCTYQAVSGAGAAAMQELEDQTRSVLAGESASPQAFPHQIAFNLFSHNSSIEEDGYNTEEVKMRNEMRKIFHDDSIAISATCVRVPVLRSHAEALHMSFDSGVTEEGVRTLLASAPGVRVVDERAANCFPMPLDAAGTDEILVGRIRRDTAFPQGIAFFLAGDQLLKGAALNAVQIAEEVIKSM